MSPSTTGGGRRAATQEPGHGPRGRPPAGVAVSPDGGSVYVTRFGDTTVSQYDVGPGGALRPRVRQWCPRAPPRSRVAVTPDGGSVYVANFGDNTVSQYDVGAGGALRPKSPATVARRASAPKGVAVSPDGGEVYVVNYACGTVSQYDVGRAERSPPRARPRSPRATRRSGWRSAR